MSTNHNHACALIGYACEQNTASSPGRCANQDQVSFSVTLPIWYDYFNGCVRARSLGTTAQKKKGKPLLVFTGLWFDICAIIFWLASGKYKIVS
jgi:hypothetical protein